MMTVRAPDPLSHAIATQLRIKDDESRSSYEDAELNFLEALHLDIMATTFERVDENCLAGAAESGSPIHNLSRRAVVERDLGLDGARTALIEAILEGDTVSERGPNELLEDFRGNLTTYVNKLAETITTITPRDIIERELRLIEPSF